MPWRSDRPGGGPPSPTMPEARSETRDAHDPKQDRRAGMANTTSAPGAALANALTLALACAAVGVLWLTWGHWGDVQVDFGREAYIPWRISQGSVLYRDLAYFNGPLSPYVNALVFLLFRPSLPALFAANTLVLSATAFLVWKLARDLTVPAAGPAALAFFLATTAFNSVTGIGNYNSLSPYSHEVTHGLLLLLAGLALLRRFSRTPGLPAGFACGAVVGLAALTKPEIALAIGAGIGTGVVLALWKSGASPGRKRMLCAAALAGVVAPPAAALGGLALGMPLPQAADSLLFMWRMLSMPEVVNLRFYQEVSGLAHPAEGLLTMGQSLALHAVLAGYLACLAKVRSLVRLRPELFGEAVPPALLLLTYALLPGRLQVALIVLLPKCWPVLLFAALAVLALRLGRSRSGRPALPITAIALVLAAWVATFKIVLNANLYHYGALLLAPAALAWTSACAGVLPGYFPAGPQRRAVAACAVALCLVLPWPLVKQTAYNLGKKTVKIDSPRGAMMADPGQGAPIAAALDFLRQRAKPGDTLAVLPEGVMLNFLGGFVNPTPYVTLMPPEWLAFGKGRIEAAYRAHPPDWIVLLHKSTEEYGYDFFGRGYARSLGRFIADTYREEALFGARPLHDDRFGLLVLHRSPELAPAPLAK